MKRKIFLTLFCVVVVASNTIFNPGFAIAGDNIEWKLNVHGSSREWTRPAEAWAQKMENRTDGKFKCEIMYGAVLGPTKDNLNGIKAGLFNAAFIVVGFDPGKTPLMDILNLPRVMPENSKKAALIKYAVLNHPYIAEELGSRWNAKILLSDFIPSYTVLSKKPIRTLDDLKGLKIRVHGGAANTVFKMLGAVPVGISPPEVYDALSKGVVDAVFFGNYAHGAYKLFEVAKYLTSGWGLYVAAASAVVVNKDAWNDLPENMKTIHYELDNESISWWLQEYQKTDEHWFKEFKKAGVEMYELSASDQDKLQQLSDQIQNDWANKMEKKKLPGKDLLNFIKELKKEVSYY